MSSEVFRNVIELIDRAKALGFRVLENGTQLIGHVPHVAPEAYLHKVFAPLSEGEILYLERGVLSQRIPAPYREFLGLSNGLSLFSGSLSLDGYRANYSRTGGDVWQPFSIDHPNLLSKPKDARSGEFFIGGYEEDGSLLYMHNDKVFRCRRDSILPMEVWRDFWEMLISEVIRLSSMFDENGRRRDGNGFTTYVE